MIKSTGAILLSDHSDRAIFIQPDEIAAFRELIALILSAPTVAGPALITEPIAEFTAKLDVPEMVNDATQPIEIHLTTVDEEVLTLLRHQIALREKLPLRIQRTCVTCGKTKILNPNMVVKSKNLKTFGTLAGTAVETAALVASGHHIRAVIKVMGSVSTIAGENQQDIPACGECQGQDFATPAVTYCPHCHKLRSETVLVECPDCETSFVDAETLADVWQSKPYAYGAFHRVANLAQFTDVAQRFEGKLNGDQRRFIEAALAPDEDLIGACRCGRPGEALRAVALVLTSRKLIWSRQLGTGPMTGGIVMWPTITAVRTLPGTGTEVTLQIESSEGLLTFTGLRGTGVSLGALTLAYTGDGLAQVIGQLANVDVTRALAAAPTAYAAPEPTSASPTPVSADGFAASPFSPVPSPVSVPPATPMPSGPVAAVPVSAVPVPSPSPLPVLSAPFVSAPPVSSPPVSSPPVSSPPVPVSPAPPVGTSSHSPVTVAGSFPVPTAPAPPAGNPAFSGSPAQSVFPPPPYPAAGAPVEPLLPRSAPPASALPIFDKTAIVQHDPAVTNSPVQPSYGTPPDSAPPFSGAPYRGAPYSGAPYSGAPYSGAPYSGAPYAAPQPPQPAPPPQLDFASAEPPPPPATAGWYPDPFGQYQWRWWSGTTWTKTFHR